VALTVLALLLERVAEHACGDTWRNIRDDLKQIKLVQLSSPNGTVWQVTEPAQEAAKRDSDHPRFPRRRRCSTWPEGREHLRTWVFFMAPVTPCSASNIRDHVRRWCQSRARGSVDPQQRM
jgi:hypothetical protein